MAGPRKLIGRRALALALVTACLIVATLPFAPPASAAATIGVSLNSNLVDGSVVTVSGTGWVPGNSLYFFQCHASSLPGGNSPCGNFVSGVIVDSSGNFQISFTVNQPLVATNNGDQLYSCTSTPYCTVFVGDGATSTYRNQRLYFAGEQDPPPPNTAATIGVSPNSNLVDGSVVSVSGTAWAPGSSLYMYQCHNSALPNGNSPCGGHVPIVPVDSSGNFQISYTVHQPFMSTNNDDDDQLYDCTVTPFCSVFVGDGSTATYRTQRLYFVASAPPSTGSMSLTPSTGLADGQSVTVSGSGYPAASQIFVWQCFNGPEVPGAGTPCGDRIPVTLDANGEFQVSFVVHQPLLAANDGYQPYDCNSGGECSVLAGTGFENPTPTRRIWFTGSPNPPAPSGLWEPCATPSSVDCVEAFTVDGDDPPAGVALRVDYNNIGPGGDDTAYGLDIALWNTNLAPVPGHWGGFDAYGAAPATDLSALLSSNSDVHIELRVNARQFNAAILTGHEFDFTIPGQGGGAPNGKIILDAKPDVISVPSAAEVTNGECFSGYQTNYEPSPFYCTVQQATADPLLLYARIYKGQGSGGPSGWFSGTESNAAFAGVPYPSDSTSLVQRLAAPHLTSDGTTTNIGHFRMFFSPVVVSTMGWTSFTPFVTRVETSSSTPSTASYVLDAQGLTVTVQGVTFSAPRYLVGRSTTFPKRWAGSTSSVHATSTGGVMVLGNLTVTQPDGAGWTTMYPCAEGKPTASNNNYVGGETIPNFVASKTDTSGNLCIYTQSGAHLIWDQVAELPGLPVHNAVRLLDTRSGPKPAARDVVTIENAAAPDTMVLGNLTVTQPDGAGWTTMYPCAEGKPTASNNNYVGGQTIPNFVASKTDVNGDLCIFTQASAHLIWDQVAELPGLPVHNATRLRDTRFG